MRESVIEKQCRVFAQQNGWWQAKIEKASVNGIPDRLFIRDGIVVFVEFKNAKGRLSDEQMRVIDTMRKHGAKVYVISSLEEMRFVFR